MQNRLFCLGMGYSAERLCGQLTASTWDTGGTIRRGESGKDDDTKLVMFDGTEASKELRDHVHRANYLVISIPPGEQGDPSLQFLADEIRSAPDLRWIGYLSTTGVYGDTGGALVNEDADRRPTSQRSQRRVAAEDAWSRLTEQDDLPIHLFRLAGIYGPGRSTFDQVRAGTARRIDFPERKFSRIHVDDIAAILRASMARPEPGAVYNICDNEPAAQADVVAYACKLLGVAIPPLIPFDIAQAEMSDMARSFWQDDRRIDNRRIKAALDINLVYPTYREGLAAVLAEEN